MAYTRIDWKNGEAGNTPLNANNLNRMDEAIAELDERAGDSEYNFDSLEARVTQAETNLNGKMNKNNPVGNGILTIDAINTQALTSMDVDTNDLEVSRISGKNGVIIATDDITVDGIPTPIGSLANTANTRSQEAETRANSAYNRASDAIGDAVIAMNRANENKAKIDLHTGLIGEGVGDKEPILGYTDGYYIAPNGSVTQYNATAKLIMIDFLDFLYSGDNIIFNHVDLLPTENCIPCAWYDVSGNFISAADGLNVIAEIDEQTFKITKHYIDYCIIPVPAGASSCKLSGLANGRADIRIQTSLSEAIKDLQSKPEPAPLVLTNPSPLPATDGKKILGIDALGKSWQGTTDNLASGNVTTTDIAIYINLGVGTYRVSANGTLADGNWYVGAWNESGSAITSTAIVADGMALNSTSTWLYGKATAQTFEFTVKTACRVRIGKLNANNTIPLVVVGITPTPTNPIPITDANPEVIAIGKNLFDGENITSGKYIGDDGSIGNDNPSGYTELITVTPNTTYTFSALSGGGGRKRIHAYDSNGNWIRLLGSVLAPSRGTAMSLTVTTPSNAKYIRLSYSYNNAYEGGANNDKNVQIEVGATASAYETYQSNSVSLPFEPKSVGSAANEFIVYEDGTGKIVTRIKELSLNNIAWARGSISDANKKRFYFTPTDAPSLNNRLDILCDIAKAESADASYQGKDGVCIDGGAHILFYFEETNTMTDAQFREWMNAKNAKMYYVLATPIETELTAEEVAAVRQLMTYKGTTIIESEMDVVSVTYSGDIKAYIDYRINQIINPTALNEVAPMNLDETEE